MVATGTRAAENAPTPVADDVESIKSSFTQLRSDVVDLLTQAFGLGRHGAEAAKDGAADAMDALKQRLADAGKYGRKQVASVEHAIEDNPLPAALIAFGVGFVIAKILSSSKR